MKTQTRVAQYGLAVVITMLGLTGWAKDSPDLRELFNASILLLAVMMLTWHNVWMASHGREIAREMKLMGAAVSTGHRS